MIIFTRTARTGFTPHLSWSKGAGFTLIEVVITLGVLALLAGFSVFATADFYNRNVVASERDTIVSFLWRVRSRAIHNVNQISHGLFIGTSTYTMFQGDSYASRSVTLDEAFSRTGGLTIQGLSEIVFRSPEGSSSSTGAISLTDGVKNATITVNGEGQIDWQ